MERIRKELDKKWNELISMGVYSSWTGFLHTCYDVAAEKNNYVRCSLIMDLIREDM